MYVVEIDDRCEFLSERWVTEALAFVRARAASLAHSGRFTLCEAFTDAPPGIAGAWWLMIDGRTVDAGIGDIADADVRVHGDYQSALAMAQVVYAAGAEAQARALREMVHRASKPKVPRITGEMPPALAPVFRALHEHMAVRTLENRNLAHRLERFGLQPQARQLADEGYTVIPRAITESFADELRGHVQREVLAHDPFTTNGLIRRHRVFEEIALHPWLCAVAQSALSQAMILGAMSGTYKEAGPGRIPLHVDSPFVQEPFPEWPHVVTACWALEDWTEASGPTWVVPRSQSLHRRPRRGDTGTGGIPIEMPKGSVALWTDTTWHWQGDRTAPGARVVIHATYNRVFVRQLEDMRMPDDVLARNPPAFRTLMGMDDPFGRSSFTGHDMARMRNAGVQSAR